MRAQTEALQILGDARIGFASVTENVDYTTPEGRLMLTMIGGFAEFFSAQLGRHVEKGARQRVEQGLQHGSVPFGYISDEETGMVPSGQAVHCGVDPGHARLPVLSRHRDVP